MADQDEEDVQNPADKAEETIIETDFGSAPTPKQVMVTDEELKRMQREAMDYKDKYLRLLADSENARKRLQKERLEISRYATENLIIDFLKPVDNFENALGFASSMSEEVRNWAIGFQMILTQFKDILTQNGVSVMEVKGMEFDPHIHEAVEMIETEDSPPGIVVEVCMKGYTIGDKVIRPARVKVSKKIEIKSNEIEE